VRSHASSLSVPNLLVFGTDKEEACDRTECQQLMQEDVRIVERLLQEATQSKHGVQLTFMFTNVTAVDYLCRRGRSPAPGLNLTIMSAGTVARRASSGHDLSPTHEYALSLVPDVCQAMAPWQATYATLLLFDASEPGMAEPLPLSSLEASALTDNHILDGVGLRSVPDLPTALIRHAEPGQLAADVRWPTVFAGYVRRNLGAQQEEVAEQLATAAAAAHLHNTVQATTRVGAVTACGELTWGAAAGWERANKHGPPTPAVRAITVTACLQLSVSDRRALLMNPDAEEAPCGRWEKVSSARTWTGLPELSVDAVQLLQFPTLVPILAEAVRVALRETHPPQWTKCTTATCQQSQQQQTPTQQHQQQQPQQQSQQHHPTHPQQQRQPTHDHEQTRNAIPGLTLDPTMESNAAAGGCGSIPGTESCCASPLHTSVLQYEERTPNTTVRHWEQPQDASFQRQTEPKSQLSESGQDYASKLQSTATHHLDFCFATFRRTRVEPAVVKDFLLRLQQHVHSSGVNSMTVLIGEKLLFNCANYRGSREPDNVKVPLTTRFHGESLSTGFEEEAVGIFLQDVLSRLALGPQILEVQLRDLLFQAVPEGSEARLFLRSIGAGTADTPALTVLAELEKQYTSDQVITAMKRRVQAFKWDKKHSAVHFTRMFTLKVRRVCASRPGYQPTDKLGTEFLEELKQQLAHDVDLYERLCEPDLPLLPATTVDEVLSIVEERGRRKRRRAGMLSLGTDVGAGRDRAHRTARVAAIIEQCEDSSKTVEDLADDNLFELHINAIMLVCGKSSDDPTVRVAELTDAEVDTLDSSKELVPIVKGLLRAFCVRDKNRTKRPEWPKHLQLAQRKCIYQPHCTGHHYVFECPVLKEHYRAGKVQVAQVRGRDGRETPLDLRQQPHYLRLIAKELNDGVLVEQSGS